MGKFWGWTVLVFTLAACAPSAAQGYFDETQDPFRNASILSLWRNRAECSQGEDVSLNAQRYSKEARVNYWLIVTYFGKDWLFIRDGNSLTLLLDGRRVDLSAPDSADRNVKSGSVSEYAYYTVADPALYNALAVAKDVKFQVRGSKGDVECVLGDAGKAKMAEFFAKLSR